MWLILVLSFSLKFLFSHSSFSLSRCSSHTGLLNISQDLSTCFRWTIIFFPRHSCALFYHFLQDSAQSQLIKRDLFWSHLHNINSSSLSTSALRCFLSKYSCYLTYHMLLCFVCFRISDCTRQAWDRLGFDHFVFLVTDFSEYWMNESGFKLQKIDTQKG